MKKALGRVRAGPRLARAETPLAFVPVARPVIPSALGSPSPAVSPRVFFALKSRFLRFFDGPSFHPSRLLAFGIRPLSLIPPLLLAGCLAWPDPALWPPGAAENRVTIDVCYRDWHTVIVEPAGEGRWREWEFAERAWYLDGRQGVSGAVRALLWPTASAVGREERERPIWERYPAGEVRRWTFVLSERGRRAMDEWLEAQEGEPIGDWPGWTSGRRSYHLFFHCHHFAATALRRAGLPIRPWWALNGRLLQIQLDRAERFHDRNPRPKPPPGAP